MRLSGSAAALAFDLVPPSVARRVSDPYIAGTTAEEAVAVARSLKERGILSTLDILGESVRTEEQVARFSHGYLQALAALKDAQLEPHISVKPSSFGSLVGWDRCRQHLLPVVRAASDVGGTVCLDMEASPTVDGTLALYRSFEAHSANIAVVLQARLHRTVNDLLSMRSKRTNVRICKGIYPEPSHVAFSDRDAIRNSFLYCLDTHLRSGGYAAIATHDEALVVASLERISQHDVSRDSYEFQFLLGVREDLASSLVSSGHRVRIYVPYGVDWHRYAKRRLRESPQMVSLIIRDLESRARGVVGRGTAAARSDRTPRRARAGSGRWIGHKDCSLPKGGGVVDRSEKAVVESSDETELHRSGATGAT